MTKFLKSLLVIVAVFLLISGVGYALFGDRVEILGTSVSVASADLKLLKELTGGTSSDNLVDSKQGPNFVNITPNWRQYYGVKIFNNGNSNLSLTSFADYETTNDVDELRQIIYIEPFKWDDVNSDGLVTDDELGTSFGKKTIVKWKTEGYILDTIETGDVLSYALRFSTDAISDSKQGSTAIFDFYFDSLSEY